MRNTCNWAANLPLLLNDIGPWAPCQCEGKVYKLLKIGLEEQRFMGRGRRLSDELSEVVGGVGNRATVYDPRPDDCFQKRPGRRQAPGR